MAANSIPLNFFPIQFLVLSFLFAGYQCQKQLSCEKAQKCDFGIGIASSSCTINERNGCPKFVITDVTINQCGGKPRCIFVGDELGSGCQFSPTKECPVIVSIESDVKFDNKVTHKFRLIGPPTSKSSYVAVGLKRNVETQTAMDDTVIMACTKGRREGRDVLGFSYRYTKGNDIVKFKKPNAQIKEHILGLSSKMLDGRIMCEFHRPVNTIVSRPAPHNDDVAFNMDMEPFKILAAYGSFDLSKEEPMQQHEYFSRQQSETLKLKVSDCGTLKSCLGKGLDGCGHIREDCPLALSVKPISSDNELDPITVLDPKPIEPQNKILALEFLLEVKGENVVMIGFGEDLPNYRLSQKNLELASIGLLISCEFPPETGVPEIVLRYNTCYLTSPVNEDTKCDALIITEPGISGRIHTTEFKNTKIVNNRAEHDWSICKFRLSDTTKISFAHSGKELSYNLQATPYYTMVAATSVVISRAQAIPIQPNPHFKNVSLRFPRKVSDETVLDLQVDNEAKLALEDEDTRPPGIINPHATGVRDAPTFFLVILLLLAISIL